MRVLSLIAGIVVLLACLFEIAMFANDVVSGDINLTNLQLVNFYSPVYATVDAILATWFFVNFAIHNRPPQ